MQIAISGFKQNPAERLEEAFKAIAAGDISQQPFFQSQIPVRAYGFQVFEHQWLGCLLTPWMLSLLVLPGPDQVWQPRKVGEKLALILPCGNVCFTVGHVTGCGQYLSSSLMSPLDKYLSTEQAVALAKNTARMALSLPVADSCTTRNPGRRTLFCLQQGNKTDA